MKTKRIRARRLTAVMVTAAVALAIGGAEAAGFFKEATGFDSAPNGKPDVIKVPGGTKWGDWESVQRPV